MDQKLALEVLLLGESALLTGPAGAGKTFLLNQFVNIAKSEGKYVSVTATTGLAATHLGGNTIHAWAGIGVYDELPSGFAEHLSKNRREIIEKTDILIIDEISMLHDYRLDMVDEVCRLVRKNDEPFGGIQIVMSGDFYQLPPINRGGANGGFVVNSRVWAKLCPVIVYLTSQYRQEGEDFLLEILTSLRNGDLRRKHAEALLKRVDESLGEEFKITELHTTNVDVDAVNQKYLLALSGDEVSYERYSTGGANNVETLSRSVLAPEVLTLKIGALVMAVKNDLSKRYVNGSIGMVTNFEPVTDYPIIEFNNGKVVTMQPDTWELRDGEKKRASISQIPLRLAWAVTIHKSQGMTLDSAKINLTKAFVPGMGYVALSRVKSLNNLYLTGINRMALTMSDEARQIDISLRDLSKKDAIRFDYLVKKAEERVKKGDIKKVGAKKVGSSWQDKIAKMREVYPNAYRPWQTADDSSLKTGFLNGVSVKKLSVQLGRHEGSIKMRLQKHFGEDVVA